MFPRYSTTVGPDFTLCLSCSSTDEIDAVTVMIGDDPYTLGLFDTAGTSIIISFLDDFRRPHADPE